MTWVVTPPPVAYLTSWYAAKAIGASLVVTPTFSASVAKTIHITVSKTVTPSFSTVTHYNPELLSGSLSVTPTFSTVVHYHPAVVNESLTVTPTFSAAMSKTIHINASLTVTPTFSATAQKIYRVQVQGRVPVMRASTI